MAIVRNKNNKLVERVVAIEYQGWENAQYSRRDMLEVVGITTSIRANVFDQMICNIFQEIGVDISDTDIQVSHCLKDKDQTTVKFTDRKNCLQIMRAKRQLK